MGNRSLIGVVSVIDKGEDMTDWKDLFRPIVTQWVLGDISPEEVPASVLLPFENPDYYNDGEVVSRLENVQQRDRFIIGTISGAPVAVASSSKFGSPSVAMVTDILGTTSAKNLIGVGFCGALQPHIRCGDLIIVTGAVRDEGTTSHYVPLSFPAVANPGLVSRLIKTAAKLKINYHSGIVWTTDAVLCEDDIQVNFWNRNGVIGVDMESAALLTIANIRGIAAGVILVASDNPQLKRMTDLTRLKAGYRLALDVALETLSLLP